MTPRGTLAYIGGLVALLLGTMLIELMVLWIEVEPRPFALRPAVVLVGAIIVFGGFHLLAGGLYCMLVHLYRTISRLDPNGDRPLRGRTLYLLGQIGSAAAVPVTAVFLFVAGEHRGDQATFIVLGTVPVLFFLMAAVLAYFAGLGLMVRDLFVRQGDIIDKREMERRRRLDEADETQTEIIPAVRPTADELREHVKEDR
jgi:hypothetical protein